ncbi:MAG TPA: hypothetical protein VLT79_06440 [Gemmatimonadales bacterium]|nr:hypothetical protein [Gemmatimonadales bacterium]
MSASVAEPTLRAGVERAPELDITSGDPLNRLEKKLGLKPGSPPRPGRMVAALLAVAVLPLLVLAGVTGTVPQLVVDPYFLRLLVALPLLELISPTIARNVLRALAEFETTGLIAQEDLGRFRDAVARAKRMRDSRVALAVIIALSFGAEVFAESARSPFLGAWARNGERLTLAGSWYLYISLALFHLVRLRWLWRVLVWWRFLFGMSRLPLRLMPAHPDQAGGLGFLSNVTVSFAALVFGFGIGVGFEFRARILAGAVKLSQLTIPMIAISLFFILCIVTPLLFFVPQLTRAMWNGRLAYDGLASRYIRRFDERWLARAAPDGELLGSSDIQSLADLGNSCNLVRSMRPFPMNPRGLLPLAAAAALAMLPAIQAEVPIKDIVKMVMGALR